MKSTLRTTPSLSAPPTPEQKTFYDECLSATEALKGKPEKRLKVIENLIKRYA